MPVKTPAGSRRSPVPAPPKDLAQSRLAAPGLWPALERLSPAQALDRVRSDAAMHTAGFAELLCERSVKAASDSAQRARDLARLAVESARRTPDDSTWRSRLQGYARAHQANALRVGGQLAAAERAFERARTLWEAGAPADRGLLNEARVLQIAAALKRARRRGLDEVLDLLDRALEIDRWGEAPALLVSKAKALEEVGRAEEAVTLLHHAALRIDASHHPRLRYVVRHNLAVNLCHLGQYAEAQRLLPRVRDLARALGNQLDLQRVGWLAGRVAAGLGRYETALATLSRVRADFVARGIAYDAALVTVEMAELHALRGDTAAVKTLALESAPIFSAQGVHREARRACLLFHHAAQQDRASADLLRALTAYLKRASHCAHLRFTPPAH